MSDFKKYFKDLLNAKPISLIIAIGTISLLLSFFKFSYVQGNFSIQTETLPNIYFFPLGLILIFSGLVLHLWSESYFSIRINEMKNGYQVNYDDRIISIIFDSIQNLRNVKSSEVIILPVNDCFDDECMKDSESSFGAFMKEQYPGKKDIIKTQIKTKLIKSEQSNHYPIGTIIQIPEITKSGHRVLLMAATHKKKGLGIVTDPSNIAICMKNLLKFASDKKITRIRLPVFGSGHGRLSVGIALSAILIESINALHYKKTNVRSVCIIIYSPQIKLKKEIRRLFSSIVELDSGGK